MPELNDPTPGQMTDQGFIDNIVDRLRPLLPPGGNTEVIVTPPPASPLPPWATYLLGILLTLALSIIAARWGVTPTPLPSLQSTPQIVVLQVPQGATVTGGVK